MKGLLHRLAERAAGSATLLRPNTRAGYGATATELGADMAGGLSAGQSAVPTALADQAALSKQRPHTNEAAVAMASSRDDPAPLVSREAVSPVQSTVGDIGATSLRTEAAPPSVQVASAGPHAQMPSRGIETAPTAVPRQADVEPEILVVSRVGSTHVDAAASHRNEPQPTRLLPLAATTPPRTVASAIPAQRPGATDDSTEVHIHIGRIDVTAVHEPPPRRRAPVTGNAPMSLDAYLAKRRS
jgi:hypothetical protein